MSRKRRVSQLADVNVNAHKRQHLDRWPLVGTSSVQQSHEIYADVDVGSQPRAKESMICVAVSQQHQSSIRSRSSAQNHSVIAQQTDTRNQRVTLYQSDIQNRVMASDLATSLASEDTAELINIQNARDLATANRSAEQMIRANRACSTRKSYDQKISLWKRWCMDRQFEDYDTVSESKLFLYLNTEVVPKGVQTKGKRYGTALSEQGLDGYIKPIVALYKVPIP